MSYWQDNTNITTTVDGETKAMLEYRAGMAGVSLSRYVAGVLSETITDDQADVVGAIRPVRDQHGSIAVTIPPEIVAHLSLVPRSPLSFVPVPRAAIIRPVR